MIRTTFGEGNLRDPGLGLTWLAHLLSLGMLISTFQRFL